MKNICGFSQPNRVLSFLRFASGLTLVSAAAAMAFVAINPSGPLLVGKSDGKNQAIGEARHEQWLKNKLALPGAERESGPLAAAEEDYANRAFPAAYVPFKLTLNAHGAFNKVKTRSNANSSSNIGTWTLIGPSTTNFPDVLTFSGAPYADSGRVTALVIDPNCNSTTCRVWMAAAGGGVWRTNNALSASGPSWTFISGSFATNAIGTLTYDAAHNTLIRWHG